MKKKALLLFPLAAAALVLGACGGNTSSTSTGSSETSTSTSTGTSTGTVVTKVTVTSASGTTLGIGRTLTLAAAVEGEGTVSQLVTWKSDKETVATVSAGGVVTGIAAGEVTITATSKADPTKSGTITLTVEAVSHKVADVKADGETYDFYAKVVAKDTATLVLGDETGFLFVYLGTKSDAAVKYTMFDIGDVYHVVGKAYDYYGVAQIYGNSDDKHVAATMTKDTTHTVTPKDPGTAKELTAEYIKDFADGTKTWNNAAIEYVKITTQVTVEAGASYNTYSFNVGDYLVKLHNLPEDVFPGIEDGTTYDIVALHNGWNTGNKYLNIITASITKSEHQVEFLKWAESTATVEVGKTVKPVLNTNIEDTITFTTSAEAVATVNAEGVITGVAEGEADITATYGDLTDTIKVTVNSAGAFVIPEGGVHLTSKIYSDAGLGNTYGSAIDVTANGLGFAGAGSALMMNGYVPFNTDTTGFESNTVQVKKQVKKAISTKVKVAEASKLTIDAYFTYATEEPKYIPAVTYLNDGATEEAVAALTTPQVSGKYAGTAVTSATTMTTYASKTSWPSGTPVTLTLYKYTLEYDLSDLADGFIYINGAESVFNFLSIDIAA